jgi:hypothetical protein
VNAKEVENNVKLASKTCDPLDAVMISPLRVESQSIRSRNVMAYPKHVAAVHGCRAGYLFLLPSDLPNRAVGTEGHTSLLLNGRRCLLPATLS